MNRIILTRTAGEMRHHSNSELTALINLVIYLLIYYLTITSEHYDCN